MPTIFDPKRHHRRSIRLPGFDYSRPGAYMVTVVTQGRVCLFGEIHEGEVTLTPWGHFVAEEWTGLPSKYPQVEIDEWVVMPNHLHGILFLRDQPGTRRKPLGQLVASFKSAVTKRIRTLTGESDLAVWQRNFHEQIVRNEEMLLSARKYVRENPLRWALDVEHPAQSR